VRAQGVLAQQSSMRSLSMDGDSNRHSRIEKAQSMRIVIPMKEGIDPRSVTPRFKNFVYDEFASRYLQAIHVEPTKDNIAQMKRRIPVDHIKLIQKSKVNGCIRDELEIDYRDRVRKLPGFANHSGDADLFRKVVHTGAGLIGARPLSPNAPLEDGQGSPVECGADEKLPAINMAAVEDRCSIWEPWYPTKQQIQRCVADFIAANPLNQIVNRKLASGHPAKIDAMLQSEDMVDLVQTTCHFVHNHIFLMPEIKDPAALSNTQQSMRPVAPLSPRTYEATLWRMNEAFALLVAPFKRTKLLLTVISVLISYCAREVAKKLLAHDFAQWARTLDGKKFLTLLDDLVMGKLDPQEYMRTIDLFGDGRTTTQKREAVGMSGDRGGRGHSKRKWMRTMYKLSPLMNTLAGSLMTEKAKAAVRLQGGGEALDDYSRTKRVESMAIGMKMSLPYSGNSGL